MALRLLPRVASVAPLCFFLISVAYKLAWTAISSLLSQYSQLYGPGILLQLNVAYFFPSIPVLMLQTAFNDRMDRRLGVPGGALLRYVLGLGSLVAITRFFPLLTAPSSTALLAVTVAVGMSYGLAFGTSYQMASRGFTSAATVALTTGFVSSGPVVLLLDLGLKRGPFYSPEGLETLFRWVSALTAVGLAAAVLLVLGSWRMLAAGGTAGRTGSKAPYKPSPSYGRDVPYTAHASERAGGLHVRHHGGGGSVALTANGHTGAAGHHAITLDFGDHHHSHHGGPLPYNGTGGGGDDAEHHHVHVLDGTGGGGAGGDSADESKVAKRDLPLWVLAARIAPAAGSIAASVGSSMLIFPFFTYMHSTGLLGERLAQVLFYIRLVGDIVGRMVPKRMQVTTVRGLLFWAAVKLALVPPLFGCIFTPHLTGGDVGACVVVALFWVLSGYVNTCSYLVAPSLVPPSQKARASGLMTVAFQSSCFGALLLAAIIQQFKFGPSGGADGAGAVH